jgi:hypothetical protein
MAANNLVEIWTPEIISNLFPDNSFGARCKKFDALVDKSRGDAKVVNLPVAGAIPGVVENRSYSTSATATQRTDGTIAMTVNDYSTDPTRVEDVLDEMFLNYDKAMSVFDEHRMALDENLHNRLLQAWVGNYTVGGTPTALSAGQILLTDGTEVGGVHEVAYTDFVRATTLMSQNNIPLQGRYCVVDAELHGQLLKLQEFIHADKLGYSNIPNGLIGRVLGVDVYVRSWTPRYTVSGSDQAGTPTLAAIGSGNRKSIVFTQDNQVARGMGYLRMDIEDSKVLNGGRFANVKTLFGATRLRQTGVVVLVQANA